MPVQTTFTDNFALGFPGLLTDVSETRTKTRAAIENINFGSVMAEAGNDGETAKLPGANQMILDADLITGNSLDGTVTVYNADGSTASPVSIPFNTSHDQTMDDLISAIEALTGISTDTDKGGTGNRTLTVVTENGYGVILSGFIVTGGASQAGVTYGTTDNLSYLAQHEHRERDSDGTTKYKAKDALNAVTKGEMWVNCETAFNTDSSVYVRFIENGNDKRGQIRTDDASGEAVLWADAVLNNSGAAAGLAKIEINKP